MLRSGTDRPSDRLSNTAAARVGGGGGMDRGEMLKTDNNARKAKAARAKAGRGGVVFVLERPRARCFLRTLACDILATNSLIGWRRLVTLRGVVTKTAVTKESRALIGRCHPGGTWDTKKREELAESSCRCCCY